MFVITTQRQRQKSKKICGPSPWPTLSNDMSLACPCIFISVANIQNPFSVHLVKLRKRALKFLAHFSLVCLGKCPKAYEKWSQMEKLIWGYIFHPSGMLWRPFGGRFLRVLHPKGVFRSLFLRISCFYKSSKPLSGANAPGRGFDDLWLYSKCTGKGFWQWEGVLNVSKSSRGW